MSLRRKKNNFWLKIKKTSLSSQRRPGRAAPILKIVSLALAMAVNQGCGPSTQVKGAAEPASVEQASTSTTTPLGPLNLVAKCTESKLVDSDFQFRSKVYQDSQGERAQIAHLRFNEFPENFGQSDDYALQFWTRAWTAGSWGPWKKRGFWVENASTNKRSPHQYTELTWAQWKQMAAFLEMTSTSPSQLLKRVDFLIATEDVVNRNQILTAKLYMGSASPEASSLVPGHLASPVVLTAQNIPEALLGLHPQIALKNSNLTEQEFQTKAQALCFN